MIKRLLTCLFILLSVSAFAQKKKVNLTKSDSANTISPTLTKVFRATFVQQYSVLSSDSAYMNPQANTFEAFGHVLITQGDTIHIYADHLNYDDNTKTAILTDNVRLVDKDATLTTNWLNYNTQTKVGTYVNGGKIVSKDGKNTLTSQNGYYYANSRDVYFRYNVISTSPDALIHTDTMRYNSGTRITYFYGPTNIYGKKDKDTLYTENGTYNTKTEQAFFGKKNRYSQGTKSLRGDSLFYDKLKGYGKAIKHITFEDTEQRMILKGDLGEYFKASEKAVVTQNPYVIFISEDKDTTKKAPASPPVPVKKSADSLSKSLKGVSKMAGNIKLADSLTVPKNINKKTDSLAKVIANQPAVKNTMPLVNKGVDSLKKLANKTPVNKLAAKAVDVAKANIPKNIPLPTKPTVIPSKLKPIKAGDEIIYTGIDTSHFNHRVDTAARVKRDTMYIGADTLETQMVTYKFLKDLQEQRRLSGIRDTSIKSRPFVPYTLKTLPKYLEQSTPAIVLPPPDFLNKPLPYWRKPAADTNKTTIVQQPAGPKTGKDSLARHAAVTPGGKAPIGTAVKVKATTDTLKTKMTKADSLKAGLKPPLSDTSRVRILSAHHNVKIFKSDLQGKSDSLFYSSADSIIRSYVGPMYWTQGAQLSGDTILLQLKNKKADNMDVFPKAVVVHIEKGDSTHFNQMAGKRLHAWFKDSKIARVLTTGNAETIYFKRSDKTDAVTDMERSLSSSININFKNGEVANMSLILKVDQKVTPIKDVKEDDKLLRTFIWKPKDRPASKEDVIHPKKKVVVKPASKPGTGKAVAGKSPVKDTGIKNTSKDSTAAKQTDMPANGKSVNKDSTAKSQPLVIPLKKGEQDSLRFQTPGVPKKVMPPIPRDTIKTP